MNITLREVLSNYDNNHNYDGDFERKLKNNCYKIDKQMDLRETLNYLKENNYLEELMNEINSIKKEKLFKSFGHGYFHNERVVFSAFIIGKLKSLNESGMKILLDAAKYHDIGRINDFTDDAHGLVGSNMIVDIMKNEPFYKEGENLNILKFIIDYHSTKDSYLENLLYTYDIKDKDMATELAMILKDSDGLDRVRLSMGLNVSDLDTRYLRTNESKSMIKMIHQLNELYLNTFKKEFKQNELDSFKMDFNDDLYLHSVGFDFFKLESILKNGILSKNKLNERGILSTKNFDGCNFDDYVSVAIYGDEFFSMDNSYDKHVRGGIIFCIGGIDSLEGEKPDNITYYGYKTRTNLVPINMGGYNDERFVQYEIPVENIKNIILPREIMEKKLTDLSYISNTISLNILESQIKYYLSVVEQKTNSTIDKEEYNTLINDARFLEGKLKHKELDPKIYQESLLELSNISNKKIGTLINGMYQNMFGIEDVRVEHVVSDIFNRNGLKISNEDEKNFYVDLGETKKLN